MCKEIEAMLRQGKIEYLSRAIPTWTGTLKTKGWDTFMKLLREEQNG